MNFKSIVSLLSVLFFVLISIPINSIKTVASDVDFSDYIAMKNGDYVLESFGSITYDYDKLGIDTSKLTSSSFITFQETDERAFVYIYSEESYVHFNRISFSIESDNFTERNIKLVSFDKDLKNLKFVIENYDPDLTKDHTIIIRQIYNDELKDNLAFIFPVGCTYKYNSSSGSYILDKEEVISITDKVVAYSWIDQKRGDFLNFFDNTIQRSYIAFNLDRHIDSINSIKYKFTGFEYSGWTNIPLHHEVDVSLWSSYHFGYSETLANKDIYNEHMLDTSLFTKQNHYNDDLQNNTFYAINENIQYEYDSGWWLWNKHQHYEFDTISRIADLDTSVTTLNDKNLDDYEFIFSFDMRSVDIAGFYDVLYRPDITLTPYFKSIGSLGIGLNTLGGNEPIAAFGVDQDILYNINRYDEVFGPVDNAPLHVEDFTVLELSYMVDGYETNSIVIDTYTDSIGGIQIDPYPVGDNFIFDLFGDVGGILQLILVIIIALVLMTIIIKLVKFTKRLFK